jgi:hypothetical protein
MSIYGSIIPGAMGLASIPVDQAVQILEEELPAKVKTSK